MERMTKRLPDGGFAVDGISEESIDVGTVKAIVDALGILENELEDGHYLKLPVPLGQKVYERDGSEWIMQPLYTAVGIGRDAGRLSTFADAAIGDTVFLAKDCVENERAGDNK